MARSSSVSFRHFSALSGYDPFQDSPFSPVASSLSTAIADSVHHHGRFGGKANFPEPNTEEHSAPKEPTAPSCMCPMPASEDPR